MNVKYSIGIPAYKAKFLRECIDSILSQTYIDFELIIVNDASPENLDVIVNSYSDSRIKYYTNEKNFGAEHVIGNWNKCLSYSSGEYFLLMGDDDALEKNYLEEFDRLINKHPDLNVYHCRSLIIDENSKPISYTQSWPEFESVIDNMWHRMNGWRQQFISDFMYRRDFLVNNNGFYNNKLAWASDDITSYQAMLDLGVAHTNLPLLRYRRSPYNISSAGSVELKLEAIVQEYKWYDKFLAEFTSTDDGDLNRKNFLKEKLSQFKTKKNISTIAYSGFHNKKSFINNLIFWLNRIKKYNISYAEFVYILILSLKKKMAR